MIGLMKRALPALLVAAALGSTALPAYAMEATVRVPPGAVSVIYVTVVLFANGNSLTSQVAMCPAFDHLDIDLPDPGLGYDVATAGTFFDSMGNEISSFNLPLGNVGDNGDGGDGGGGEVIYGG